MRILTTTAARMEEVALTKKELDAARALYLPFIKTLLVLSHEYDRSGPSKDEIAFLKSEAPTGIHFMRHFGFSDEALKKYKKALAGFIKHKTYYHDDVQESLEDLAVEVKGHMPKIKSHPHMPVEAVEILTHWYKNIVHDSEAQYKLLVQKVNSLGDDHMSRLWAPKVKKTAGSNARKDLAKIVKDLTGKAELLIPREVLDKLAKKNPQGVKDYNKARANLRNVSKMVLLNYVNTNGKVVGESQVPVMDAQKVRETMLSQGYTSAPPEGYEGFVDGNGSLYTKIGRKVNGGSGTKVRMNPDYDPKKDNGAIFQSWSNEKNDWGQRVYSVRYKQERVSTKYAKTAKLADEIEGIRQKWGMALQAEGKLNQALALVLETSYQTLIRVGSVGNQTKGANTFGITTMLCRHAKVLGPNSIRFSFKGKSGVNHRIVMEGTDKISKLAIRQLRKLIDTGAQGDALIRHNDRPVNPQVVNTYFKSLGAPCTIKAMRTLRGTLAARDVLADTPKGWVKNPPDDKAVSDYFYKKMLEVGAILGHKKGDKITPDTAIKHYIDPSVIQGFFDRVGVRPPKKLELILRSNQTIKDA